MTTAELPTPRRSVTARIAVVAGALYVVLLVLLHLTRPDVSLTWQTTSEYARGEGGWVMVLAFLLQATALVGFALSARRFLRSVPGRIGLVLLLAAALGTAIGAIFVTDPIDTPQNAMSFSGTLHGLGAGLALMLTPIAALMVNIALARRSDKGVPRTLLLLTAPLPLLALVIFMIVQTAQLPADGTFGPDVIIGPAERTLVAAYALWLIVAAAILVSARLRSQAGQSATTVVA
jgi:hypothetical protein